MKIKSLSLAIAVCAMILALGDFSAYANKLCPNPSSITVSFNKGELFVDTVNIETGSTLYLEILEQIRNEAINGSASHSLFLAKFLKSKEDAVGRWNLEKSYRDSLTTHYIEWFDLAAKQGSPEAMCELGKYYESKDYYTDSYDFANIDRAIELLTNSADLGYANSMYWLGCIYRTKYIPLSRNREIKNPIFNEDIAADWYVKGANENDYDCVYELAWLYKYGLGHVKKDKKKHIEYLEKSAEMGNPFALQQLSDYYTNGKYVKKDPQKAAELRKQWLAIEHKN